MTPSARSTHYFREHGFIVCKVEQRLPIPGKFVTRDAFNIGDLLVAKEGWGIALVQVTSAPNISAREKKIRANSEFYCWLAAKGRFLLHGWAKRGLRGERKTWTLTSKELSVLTPPRL